MTYHACVSRRDTLPDRADAQSYRNQRDDLATLSDIKDLEGWQIYLCDNPEMVVDTKKLAFLAGANLTDIHADPFEPRDLRQVPRPDAREATN